MKPFLSLLVSMLLLLNGSCQKRSPSSNPGNDQPAPTFALPEEAARQGLRDMLAIARLDTSMNFGLEVATIERAQLGKPIRQTWLDFNKLLRLGAAIAIDSLVSVERSLLVPLSVDNRAVAAIEVSHRTKGWRVATLGNQKVAADLNLLRATTDTNAEITLHEVPNLSASVYSVRQADGMVRYHTDYNGLSLREPLPLEQLYDILRRDAQAFQRKYGNRLHKERLVR